MDSLIDHDGRRISAEENSAHVRDAIRQQQARQAAAAAIAPHHEEARQHSKHAHRAKRSERDWANRGDATKAQEAATRAQQAAQHATQSQEQAANAAAAAYLAAGGPAEAAALERARQNARRLDRIVKAAKKAAAAAARFAANVNTSAPTSAPLSPEESRIARRAKDAAHAAASHYGPTGRRARDRALSNKRQARQILDRGYITGRERKQAEAAAGRAEEAAHHARQTYHAAQEAARAAYLANGGRPDHAPTIAKKAADLFAGRYMTSAEEAAEEARATVGATVGAAVAADLVGATLIRAEKAARVAMAEAYRLPRALIAAEEARQNGRGADLLQLYADLSNEAAALADLYMQAQEAAAAAVSALHPTQEENPIR